MSELEDEVERMLKELIASHLRYEYYRDSKVEGRSGHWWEVDFVLMKGGALDAAIECKDVDVKKSSIPTFEAQMCRSYTRLNDIHLRYPSARLYVILREFPTSSLLDKWEGIFRPIGAALLCLGMLEDLGSEELLKERLHI